MSHAGGLDRIKTAELSWGLTAMTLAGAWRFHRRHPRPPGGARDGRPAQ
jgi:hypothetical protein